MRWKKATPGGGEETRAEQFAYVKTEAGLNKTWTCWCAHEPYWCKVHEHTDKTPGTKVCVTWFTDGALSCPRCRPGVLPTTVAYVPVWREVDLRPCLVICHESTADLLKGVEFGTYCMVGRVEKGAGVFLKPSETKKRWVSDQPRRQSPCDITVSLLTVWKYPALEAWLKLPRTQAQQRPNLPRMRLSVPPPASEVEALAVDAERKQESGWSNLVNDALRGVVKRGNQPSTNGKHDAGDASPLS